MVNTRFFTASLAILGVLVVTFLTQHSQQSSQKMSQVKVYECLEVGEDLASLKKHMESHTHFIDYFVLVECLDRGEKRDLKYEQKKADFKDFSHKVIYLAASSLPETQFKDLKNFYFKNQYLKALDHCFEEDVILFSDAKSLILPQDLKKGVLWLKKHPKEIVQLRARSMENKKESLDIRAAMYSCVKEALPAYIEKTPKPKTQKLSWRSAFFPVN